MEIILYASLAGIKSSQFSCRLSKYVWNAICACGVVGPQRADTHIDNIAQRWKEDVEFCLYYVVERQCSIFATIDTLFAEFHFA